MHYNSTLVIGLVIVFYLFTWLLAKYQKIQLNTHRKIWNVLLAVFFLVSGLLGLLLAISLDNKISLAWYSSVLWLHVEMGIAMAVVALFHFAWHLRYFMAALGGQRLGKILLWLGVPVLALATYLVLLAKNEPAANDNDNDSDKSETVNSPGDNSNNNSVVINTNSGNDYDALKVTSACIGCGRCVATDPEHFAFDYSERQAEVISEDNLESAKLDRAISNCPARAIVRS